MVSGMCGGSRDGGIGRAQTACALGGASARSLDQRSAGVMGDRESDVAALIIIHRRSDNIAFSHGKTDLVSPEHHTSTAERESNDRLDRRRERASVIGIRSGRFRRLTSRF